MTRTCGVTQQHQDVRIRGALSSVLEDGDAFVVFKAGGEVHADRVRDGHWFDSSSELSKQPDLYAKLLEVNSQVERGYGDGPSFGLFVATSLTILAVHTGFLAGMVSDEWVQGLLVSLKSGWVYAGMIAAALTLWGFLEVLFQSAAFRGLRTTLHELALEAGHSPTELRALVQGDYCLETLRREMDRHKWATTPAEVSSPDHSL